MHAPIHLRISSLINSVFDCFHRRLPSDLLFLLNSYLTDFYVSLEIQDVCSTCCETSPENDIFNRHWIYEHEVLLRSRL